MAASRFFFFQAEDGIRDWSVTGVQTCALPISGVGGVAAGVPRGEAARTVGAAVLQRSEERRVGKECRSRWWSYHEKKKLQKVEQEVTGARDHKDVSRRLCTRRRSRMSTSDRRR